jgi:hypothetical protein
MHELSFIILSCFIDLQFPLERPFVLFRDALAETDNISTFLAKKYPSKVWKMSIFQGPEDDAKTVDGKRRLHTRDI